MLRNEGKVKGRLSVLLNEFLMIQCGIKATAATKMRTIASRTNELFHAVGPRVVFNCKFMGTSWVLHMKAEDWKGFINNSRHEE